MTEESEDFPSCYKINASKNKRGFYVDGLIQGTFVTWKVDTGAKNTFITEDIFNEIPPENRPVLEPARKKFVTASGQDLYVLGTAHMTLNFDDFETDLRVFVGRVSQNLLGADFYSYFRCNWDHENGGLFVKVPGNNACLRRTNWIIASQDISVPPGHEVVIQTEFTYPENSEGIPVVLSEFLHKHKLLVARTLLNARTFNGYLRLFNLGRAKVTVKHNARIAIFSPVIKVSNSERLNSEEVYLVEEKNPKELPAHLIPVYEKGRIYLSDQEASLFKKFLQKRVATFADPNGRLGQTTLGEHHIVLNDERPFKEASRNMPLFKRDILNNEIQKLEDLGIIEKSHSPWSSQLVLVQKKDKTWRVCVDYRRLNSRTIKDAYPIPRIDDNLDALVGSMWFTSLDLNMAYHQVPMSERDKEKTAFATPRGGLYQYSVMPFGLCNAPATFQRIIEKALCGLQWNIAVLYLDDIIVFGKSFQEHLENLNQVCDRLDSANLKLKPSKCFFFRQEVEFLGHVVSRYGVHTDPKKIEAIRNIRIPKNVTDLRRFLGIMSYYRKFVKGFAETAKCLHALTKKNGVWNWTPECDHAFHELRDKLIHSPILGYPDVDGGPFVLDTDASNDAIGCVLSQIQNGEEKVMQYASRTLNSHEKNYCVTRKEMLAVVFFIKHFKHYLLGREFILRTDHGSLTWLHRFRDPDGQVCRWLQQLSAFDFKIIHRPGKRHSNADALSRLPSNYANDSEEVCRQCNRRLSDIYDGKQQSHIHELRKDISESGICDQENIICNIVNLFSEDHCSEVKSKKKGRTENRPKRAISVEMPVNELSYENIRKAQENDDGIFPILKLLKMGKDKPSYQDISHLHPECKFWHARWELLRIHNDVLCILWTEKDENRLRICTPNRLREDVMWYLHDAPTSGHMGIYRTQQRASFSSYYWPGMRQTVRDYVKSCEVCEERKNPGRKRRHYMETYTVGGRFERVAADIAGPFPKTANDNVYILVISDYFSKFAEIFPIPNMEAKTIANVFFRGWIKRYGCPYEFHSDQGVQFESLVFKHLCSMFDIAKTRTTAFHPRSDGMVERLNRTIKDMLSKYINVKQTDWDDYIDCVVMAYNSSVHETTGITPFRMMFGSEMTIPVDLQTESLEIGKGEKISETKYVKNLCKNLELVHKFARERTSGAVCRQKRHYDKTAVRKTYNEGDIVRRFQPKQIVGTKLKLARNWTGPWIITKKLSDVLFEIKHSRKSNPVIVHADNIKSFQIRKTAELKLKHLLKFKEMPSKTVNTPELDPSSNSKDAAETPRVGKANAPKTNPKLCIPIQDPPRTDQPRDQQTVGMPKKTMRGRVIRKPKRYYEDCIM